MPLVLVPRSEGYDPFSLTAAAAAMLMFVLWPGSVSADEFATTHRPGDEGSYYWACHNPDSVVAITMSEFPNELGSVLVEQGKCFNAGRGRRISMYLIKWIAGPLIDKAGVAGSVWEILDAFGDTEYALFSDAGGPHVARREMAF